jgi:hypothetical protein
MSKYQSLTDFLAKQLSDEITLTLDNLEDADVVGITLPVSAKTYRQWWENQSSDEARQCRSWLDAGWEVKDVNLTAGHVTFRRRTVSAEM